MLRFIFIFSYELGDLHPYSKYNISIEAIDKGKLYGKTILATYQVNKIPIHLNKKIKIFL